MYIFIIVNQLTTQNNDRYCPETLTGTAFSIKNYAQNPNMAFDYHKVGMCVKWRLVGTHRTHFHSHIWRSEVKGPL